MTLALNNSGGTYITYLRATSDALSGPALAGTFYALEVQNPTFSNGVCTATLALYRQQGGTNTQIFAYTIACHNGMVVRSAAGAGWLMIYLDDGTYYWLPESSIATGQPGIGARDTPDGNGVSEVDLGPWDRIAPGTPVNLQGGSQGLTAFPDHIDMQWPGVVDDANGTGVWAYQIYRDGNYVTNQLASVPGFVDATVSPGTTYSYTIYALDYHLNYSPPASFSITTPPAGAIDPRRWGVRPGGTYWGAGSEQIDILSGNLNYTLPLLKAQGRGGWAVPFALSYNSQLWRADSGSNIWKLGADIGYGFGWQLQAGSLTPYLSGTWTIHHYTFTDSTGAQYRLTVNNGGVWSSQEGIYLWYDSGSQKLYFPDGSSWLMAAVSGGLENDAGTQYPTIMQDTNGNQILIRYNTGVLAITNNSSSRINEIEDVRAVFSSQTGTYRTYAFSYSQDAIPHLLTLSKFIGTAEGYTFNTPAQNLSAPFSPNPSFGVVNVLQSATITGLGIGHQFEYNSSGEMTKAIQPYGGYLRWDHGTYTYVGNRSLREVQNRHLLKQTGAMETSYPFWRDPNDANLTCHSAAALDDPSGAGERAWFFYTSGNAWSLGLEAAFEERVLPGQIAKRRIDLTWAQDPSGRPYVGTALTTLDPTNSPVQSKTTQTLDTYGNVTQTNIYDYGNLTTPARTYTNTYLYQSNSNYASRYIWNRLVSSTVSNGSQQVPLVANQYDGYGGSNCSGYTSNLYNLTGLREHDDANYGTGFTYRGNVTVATVPQGATCFSHQITGDLHDSTGLGGATSATPSANTNYAAPSVITVNSLSTTLTYSGFLGVTSATGQNSDSATTTYDAAGRPQTSTSPHGAVTNYTYTTSPPTSTATTNQHWTRTTFDGLRRTIKVENGDGGGTKSIVDTVYDSCACSPIGKLKQVSQPYAPGGAVYWTTYNYDALGRTVSVVSPDGTSTTNYVYQGNTTTITDPAGHWKKYVNDAMGQLIQVIEPNPGS